MNELDDDSHYNLKPNLKNALIIVIIYSVLLILLQKLSGVPYTAITKSSSNMLFGVLIPVFIASVLLTIIALWSGWWKDVWRDKFHIKDHPWMHIFLILLVLVIIGNFFKGNIGSVDSNYIIYAFIATLLVGYSEELLSRGLLIRGARGSGFTEVKVFLIVMIVFGALHVINILSGQNVITTLLQMLFAGLIGGVFYTIFRKSGFLIVTMILHALYDFSLFTQGTSQLNQIAAISNNKLPLTLFIAATMWISYILLLFAVRNFNVKKNTKKDKELS